MAKTYCAGELTERIVIESRAATTQNALGENTTAWATLDTVWAKAEPLRGREFFASGQMQQACDVRFVIRYRADMGAAAVGAAAAMRVLWRGVYHDITAAIEVDGALTWIELMTVHGVRDGG